ncbi:hypothetical protein C1N70_24380 [Cytobacillus firmus]
MQFLESWIDEYQSYLKSFIGSLKALEPSPSGFIRQEFLEHELKQGLRNTLQITADLTQEANSDIVALPPLEDGRFIQAAKSAEDSSQTVEKLEDFDHRETAALDPLLQGLSHMNQYILKVASMFQSGSLSLTQYQPKSLNWKDFHEGGLFGVDILGVAKSNRAPVVVNTKRYRDLGMDKDLVVIEDAGEYAYCLYISEMENNECPVIAWNRPGGLDDYNTAKNFYEFLSQRLLDAKEAWEEDF